MGKYTVYIYILYIYYIYIVYKYRDRSPYLHYLSIYTVQCYYITYSEDVSNYIILRVCVCSVQEFVTSFNTHKIIAYCEYVLKLF